MQRSMPDKQLIAHDRRKWIVLLLLFIALLVLALMLRTPLAVAHTPRLLDPIQDTELVVGDALAFEGVGLGGGQVVLIANGTPLAETTVNQSGNWQMEAPFDTLGTYAVVVNALDQNGDAFSASRAITIDVVDAVEIEATPTPSPVYSVPTILLPNTTTAGNVVLAGDALDGESIALYIDAELVAVVPIDESNAWSFATELSQGDHTIKAIAVDADNNELIASLPLALNLKRAENDAALNIDLETEDYLAGEIDFAGLSIPDQPVQLLLDGVVAGETQASSSGRWGTSLTVDPGEHTLKIYALDASGNPSAASETIDFVVLTEDGNVFETPTPAPTNTLAPVATATATVTPEPTATVGPTTAPQAEPNTGAAPPTTVPIDCTQDINHGRDFGSYWRVGECDTLFYISRQTGVPVLDLQAANTWVPNFDFIVPGWELTLPER